MGSVIGFVSDFGLDDTWVGVCHAVIHETCPDAHVVDLAHHIPPYDTWQAAVTAAAAVYQLPAAIHLVVVDPGVGGGRRDLCLVSSEGVRLVGPDNGVLIPAAERSGGVAEAFALQPPPGRGVPSPTFHARDILAPAAAALACGAHPASIGVSVERSNLAPAPFTTARAEGGRLLAQILGVDRFGSIRTSITAEMVEEGGFDGHDLEIEMGHSRLASVPFARTFSDVPPGSLVALLDSSGWLTLAENTGSAFERFGVEPGAPVHVRVIE